MSKISELSDGGVIQGGDTLIAVRSGGNVKVTYGGSTTANIDGGTIDGTTIGGTTPAAGNFTTVTADGLTVDGEGTFAKNQTADTAVEVSNLGTAGATTTASFIVSEVAGTPKGWFRRYRDGTATTAVGFSDKLVFEGAIGSTPTNRMEIASNGDVSLYEDTGTTAKFFWDSSAEALGIGTDSPSAPLAVESGNAGDTVASFKNSGFFGLTITPQVGGSGAVTDIRLGGGESLSFSPNNTEAMRINSDGNVGIGTSSPARKLTVEGDSGDNLPVRIVSGATTTSCSLEFKDPTTTADYKVRIGSEGDELIAVAGGSQAMRIDSAGNVGIGTSSPSAKLDVELGVDGVIAEFRGGDSDILQIKGASNTVALDTRNTEALTFEMQGAERMRIDSAGNVVIGASSVSNPNGYGSVLNIEGYAPALVLSEDTGRDYTIGVNGNKLSIFDETDAVMTIDDSGNLLVGCTSKPSASVVGTMISDDLDTEGNKTSTSLTTTATHFVFFNPNGAVGSISTSGSATAYNTSSDQRLKDNIVDAPSASDDIDAIQVRSFDWKADGSHQKYGMVAQELQSVAPEAVSGDADSDDMMGVDYSKLVPMMLKEIQSLRARVAQLEGAN